MMDDILQFVDKSGLTTGKVAWPAPKGPSTQHSSDRYLRLKESRDFSDLIIFALRSSLSEHDSTVDWVRLRFKKGAKINTRHLRKKTRV